MAREKRSICGIPSAVHLSSMLKSVLIEAQSYRLRNIEEGMHRFYCLTDFIWSLEFNVNLHKCVGGRYLGSERSMLISNTLFRVGGAAILLTNKLNDRHRVKYELEHVVRVHLGADDMAYKCGASLLLLFMPGARPVTWCPFNARGGRGDAGGS